MAHIDALGTRTAPSSFYSRLSDGVRSAWAGYWVRRAERATVFVLHKLDDRTLKDIGMDRSEIEFGGVRPGARSLPIERPPDHDVRKT